MNLFIVAVAVAMNIGNRNENKLKSLVMETMFRVCLAVLLENECHVIQMVM